MPVWGRGEADAEPRADFLALVVDDVSDEEVEEGGCADLQADRLHHRNIFNSQPQGNNSIDYSAHPN